MTCTQDKLVELAERCEAATDADEALDLDIWIALGRPNEWLVRDLKLDAPDYTASLDAAMMMVPAGWDVQLRGHFSEPHDTHLAVLSDKAWLNDEPIGKLVQGDGQTLSLALCIAALRARVQS